MELFDAIKLGKAWADMGGSVAEQLEDLAAAPSIDHLVEGGDLNPNALPVMRSFLRAAIDAGCDEAEYLLGEIDEHIALEGESPEFVAFEQMGDRYSERAS